MANAPGSIITALWANWCCVFEEGGKCTIAEKILTLNLSPKAVFLRSYMFYIEFVLCYYYLTHLFGIRFVYRLFVLPHNSFVEHWDIRITFGVHVLVPILHLMFEYHFNFHTCFQRDKEEKCKICKIIFACLITCLTVAADWHDIVSVAFTMIPR